MAVWETNRASKLAGDYGSAQPSAVGGRDPGDCLQRGIRFTPGGPEPETNCGLLQ